MSGERWSQAQDRILRSNFFSRTASEIAEMPGLEGKTASAVYNRARQLGLRKNRKWRLDEDQYVDDSLGRMELAQIAREIFRTLPALRERLKKRGIKIGIPDDEITIKKLAARTGITEYILYGGIRNETLPIEGRRIGSGRSFLFDLYEVEKFVREHHYFLPLKCFECQAETVGSMFCEEHAPMGLPKKKEPITRRSLRVLQDDYRKPLSEALKTLRREASMSQEAVSIATGHNKAWYCDFETAKKPFLPIDDLANIVDKMGYTMTIVFEKKEEK